MKEADRQAIALLNQIHDAQAAGGDASFASLTGSPEDNAALDAALDAKQGDLGFTPVPDTRTVNGHALSGDVTVTKGDVGLGNADNTADAAKPVSTDQATAIAGKVSDTAYDATSWDGVTTIAPSKNAVRDKIEAVVASIPPAHSGGVIGTAQVVVAAANFTLSHPLGVLASGITLQYFGAGDYEITKSTNFANDPREFRVGASAWGGIPFFITVENTNSDVFRIRTFDITGTPVEVDRFMISVETLSQ